MNIFSGIGLVALCTAFALEYGYAQFWHITEPGPLIEPRITLSFEETTACVHRIDAGLAFDVKFRTVIACDVPVVWTLTPLPTRAFGPPNLTLISDLSGNSYALGQVVVPLIWEFSMDGGEFRAMELTPDQQLRTVIAPGMHQVVLRARGSPAECQAAGYYRINLSQSFDVRL